MHNCFIKREGPYVIVTPAHNEGKTLQTLIEAMAQQTYRPLHWVIVSDASTDETESLVKKAQSYIPWLSLICLKRCGKRNFAGKAVSFNTGVKSLNHINYKYIANLDADVSFASDYFEFLISQMESDPKLGVAGTPFSEMDFKGYDYRFTNPEHVTGMCQLFRRDCLEQIGGYVPLEYGGVDWVAVTTARMLGWKTRTFPERRLVHHRPMGTGNPNWGNLKLRQGRKDYMLGNSLWWQLFRFIYQVRFRPYVFGGLLILIGYLQFALIRKPRQISDDLVRFARSEQYSRLRAQFFRLIKLRHQS